MSVSETTLLLQSGAVIAQTTAAVTLWCGVKRPRRDGLLAVGLWVGAVITAIDTTRSGASALPFAAWALLAFGVLATLAGQHAPRIAGPVPSALLAAIALVGLHHVHTEMPGQPGQGITFLQGSWFPFDVYVAVPLAWLAWRGTGSHAVRRLMLMNALGLAVAGCLPLQRADVLAVTQIVATLPVLSSVRARELATLAIGSGSATLFALTCALRASLDASDRRPQFAGAQDPLLVLAIGTLFLGLALLRSYRGLSREPRTTTTSSPKVAAPATANLTTATLTTAPTSERIPSFEATTLPTTHDITSVSPSVLSTTEVLHDLRQPVTSMLAAAGLLSASKDAEELASQTETLRTYGQQLATAIADLEDFERLLRGKVEAVDEAFDLRALLQSCVTELTPSVADRSIELRLDLDRSLPRWVQGDGNRTRQLIVRMLQSIARHASFGPIDITAAADEQLHVSVLGRTAALPEAGRGLALAFCRQLATLLGGELKVSLLPELGAELRLTLPKRLAPEWEVDIVDADDRSNPTDRASEPLIQGRVLLVDDSPDHLRLLGRMLAKVGAQVSTADSGELALHLLSSTPFDLVLVTMQLSGVDGFTTVQRLRERGLTTPVIALTTATDPASVERCLAAGCNGHIGKPVDFDLLRQTLAMHLNAAAE